jgi:hypothetical protein
MDWAKNIFNAISTSFATVSIGDVSPDNFLTDY